MQLEVKPSRRGADWTTLNYKSLGSGNLEMYIFYGPDFLDVIKQYQEMMGRPKMMPLFAHGFMSRSFAYKDSNLAIETVEKYKDMGMPVQSLILPLDYFNAYLTPDNKYVTDIRAKFPNAEELSLVLPFTPMVPNTNLDVQWVKAF